MLPLTRSCSRTLFLAANLDQKLFDENFALCSSEFRGCRWSCRSRPVHFRLSMLPLTRSCSRTLFHAANSGQKFVDESFALCSGEFHRLVPDDRLREKVPEANRPGGWKASPWVQQHVLHLHRLQRALFHAANSDQKFVDENFALCSSELRRPR